MSKHNFINGQKICNESEMLEYYNIPSTYRSIQFSTVFIHNNIEKGTHRSKLLYFLARTSCQSWDRSRWKNIFWACRLWIRDGLKRLVITAVIMCNCTTHEAGPWNLCHRLERLENGTAVLECVCVTDAKVADSQPACSKWGGHNECTYKIELLYIFTGFTPTAKTGAQKSKICVRKDI